MTKMKGHKIALVVGLFVAAMHAIWALAVAIGIGQAYLDWIFPMHFLNSLYTVMTFNFLTAIFLVIIAFIASYASTWLFVCLWNVIKVKN